MIVAIFGGVVLASGGTIMAGTALADAAEVSDETVLRFCGGQNPSLPGEFTIHDCKFAVSGRSDAILEYSAVAGQPSVGACLGGGTSEISGSFSYAESNTYTFGGSISFTTGPFVEVAGGGEYSTGTEQGVSTAGTFPLDEGQKGQIIVGRHFENVEGSWQAEVWEVKAIVPGGAGIEKTPRTIGGQTAHLPIANDQEIIDVEKRGCDESFQTPVGDVQFIS